ncbi:pyrimidine-nucleoside phosphorylase [Desulfolucanica intricata]|uniref:pyrimidine-nucleoside phosphorylase n=1 Tax=Desulfolucanica intricata TaxID=1285191 RepID=UPI00082A92E8|nr:pyrimidine-nucleoside phosphorylase [Desulfolucanica intricata]
MRMYDLILKKRRGISLTADEIEFFVKKYDQGEIPDYQVSALLMAIFFRGLDAEETAALTLAIADSGDRADLSPISGIKVDKHSTGGVGDKTTLVLIPLVAAAGVPVAKMSGRGLGHTGGTIDKLESIPGMKVNLEPHEFIEQVNRVKAAVVAQTGKLAPADKKLYALRDVTATVDSIPLIASSVMSKKIAAGADAIVLDVKTGSGAFMRKVEDAYKLAKTMVSIGKKVNLHTVALVTNMDEPLGMSVGNALEVLEAIHTLQGNGPHDLEQLCLALGSQMLLAAKKVKTEEDGQKLLKTLLKNGKALEKFREIILAQGGNAEVIDNTALLPRSSVQEKITVTADGYVQGINAEMIGNAAMMLGAGRETKDSEIDLAAGLVLEKKVGDKVASGDILAILHTNKSEIIEEAGKMVKDSFIIGEKKPGPIPMIYGIIGPNDV